MARMRGFTLLELSIVLVIIGLIAGGVLVGRDLISAAEIRAQIHQLDEYNTAVNAFRLKYNVYPGDAPPNQAVSFGMPARSGADGHGDGDALIESCVPGDLTVAVFGCENILFWADLSHANLIREQFTSATDTTLVNMDREQLKQYMPAPYLMKEGQFAVAVQRSQGNWFAFANIATVGATGEWTGASYTSTLRAPQAHSIDTKIDDGKPRAGHVQAYQIQQSAEGNFFGVPPSVIGTECVAASGEYNFAGNTGYGCQLRMRMDISKTRI